MLDIYICIDIYVCIDSFTTVWFISIAVTTERLISIDPVSRSNWKTALAKLDLPTNMNPYMYYVIYSCFIVMLLLGIPRRECLMVLSEFVFFILPPPRFPDDNF